MLSRKELRVLGVLDGPKTRSELGDELNYTPSTVTNAISRLTTLNLVVRERSGQNTVFAPTEARCLEVYQSLTKANPHIDFPDLLTASALELFYYLSADDWTRAATLVYRSDRSKATVYRTLDRFTNRAIVVIDNSRYRLHEDFAELHTFVTEFRHHIHRNRIRRETTGGTLIWESYDEFLVRVDEPVSNAAYYRTGLDAFSEYGLEFFTTAEFYYFYSDTQRSLSPADLVCQLLLIDDGARHRKYALLLIAATKTDHSEVRKRAAYYGLEDRLASMMTYLETTGDESGNRLPPWEEFESLARDYRVEV